MKERKKDGFLVPADYPTNQTAANSVVCIQNGVKYTKSLVSRPYVVTHVQYDGAKVYASSGLDIFDVDQVKRKISKYWVKNFGGQIPSSATLANYAAAFKQYAQISERVAARFLQFRRVQNAFNVENTLIGKIGTMLNNPKDYNLGNLQIVARADEIVVSLESKTSAKLTSTNSVYGDFSVNGISNAVWLKDYVAKLDNIKISPIVLGCVKTLFTGFIELSSDDDETLRYVCFWQPAASGDFPSTTEDGDIAKFKTSFDSDVTALEVLKSTYPTLEPILEDMGWVNLRDNMPTDRDLEGKSFEIIRDKDDALETMFKSVLLSQVDVQTNADLLANSIIEVTSENYLPDILTAPKRNIDMSNLYNLGQFIRGKVTTLCANLIVMNKAGGSTGWITNIECTIADNLAIYSSDDASVARKIQSALDAVQETDALVGGPLHRITTAGPLNTVTITINDSLVESSAKTYIIPEGDVGSLIFIVNNAFFIKMDRETSADPVNTQTN